MSNEVVQVNVAQVVAQWEDPGVLLKRRERMVTLMKSAMSDGKHFGKVPGCKQNSLFQPGSQLLSVSFRIGHEPVVEDLSTADEKKYRVTDRVFDQASGVTLGYGVGECSSSEEKYAWKRCYSEAEWDNTPSDRKKIKYGEYNGKPTETRVIRTNPVDLANTILKMARKRANVNGTIEVLAASDVFTQDVEDLPEGMNLDDYNTPPSDKADVKPSTAAPENTKSQSQGEAPSEEERKAKGLISVGQEKRMYAIAKGSNCNLQNVKNWIAAVKKEPVGHLWMIKKGQEYDKVCATIEKQPDFYAKYATVKTAANPPKTDDAPHPADTTGDSGAPTLREAFEIQLGEMVEAAGFGTEKIDATIKGLGYGNLSQVPEADFPMVIKHFSETL